MFRVGDIIGGGGGRGHLFILNPYSSEEVSVTFQITKITDSPLLRPPKKKTRKRTCQLISYLRATLPHRIAFMYIIYSFHLVTHTQSTLTPPPPPPPPPKAECTGALLSENLKSTAKHSRTCTIRIFNYPTSSPFSELRFNPMILGFSVSNLFCIIIT